MPTYRNNTSLRPLLDGRVVEPKSIAYSLVYHDEDTVGLRLIDDKPYYNPLILSEVITENKEVIIPEKDGLGKRITKMSLHIYVKEGSIDLRYNAKDNLPATLLYDSARWNVRMFERNINKLIITGLTEKFEVWILIEKLP